MMFKKLKYPKDGHWSFCSHLIIFLRQPYFAAFARKKIAQVIFSVFQWHLYIYEFSHAYIISRIYEWVSHSILYDGKLEY